MSVLSKPYFHDEAAAFAHVESILWENGPVCPHCGGVERIYVLNNVRSKPSKKNPEGVVRHGLKKCGQCSKQFTVRIGTIFEESHIEMHKWLQAIHLMVSSKKGVSAHQLHRTLEITYKSAWFLAHRIREAMRNGELAPMGGNGKVVEADETYFGKTEEQPTVRTSGKPFKSKVRRGPSGKRAVVALLVAKRKKALPSRTVWREGKSFGSVVGELLKLDDLEHDREFVIVPPIGAPITCVFPDQMLDDMGKFWRKIVKVEGALYYGEASPFPIKVEAAVGGVHLYRGEGPSRSLSQMRGAFAGKERTVVEWDSLLHG